MKYFQTLILLFASTLTSFAQVKNAFWVEVGTNFPLQEYASTATLEGSGFATSGISTSLHYSREIWKRGGFQAAYFYMNNPINSKTIEETVENDTSIFSIVIGRDFWSHAAFLVGLYQEIGIGKSKKFKIRGSLMGGILNSVSPKVQVLEEVFLQGSRWTTYESTRSTSWSFSAGIGFKYDLGEKFFALIDFDYFIGSTSWDYSTLILPQGGTINGSRDLTVTIIETKGGFGFRF